MKMYCYKVYGLSVSSEIEIPELTEAPLSTAEVHIRFGDVAFHLVDAIRRFDRVEYGEHSYLLRVENIASFLVENGCSITVDRRLDRSRRPGDGSPDADVRLFLLGSAFGALLHQRGCLPLHVSAVDSGSGVWAFTGPSGAGKSTLAGWLSRQYGWPIISDDVSSIKPTENHSILHPGPRRLKLWRDAVEHLGCHNERLVQDLSNTPKFQLHLDESLPVQPAKLKALVLLETCQPGEPSKLERLKGVEAFKACCKAVYRPNMSSWFRKRHEFIQDLVELAQKIEVYRFRRQWSLSDMSEELAPLMQELSQSPATKAGVA